MRCQPLLGTYVEVRAQSDDLAEHDLSNAIDAAFDAVRKVQSTMSVFEPSSDLARINAGEYVDHPQPVHPWLWDVLNLSKRIHALCPSFDIAMGHTLVNSGLRPKLHEGVEELAWGTLEDLILSPDDLVQTLRPLYLDLGGIAKGYAVDRAVETLQARGVNCGCVNAGGDLRVWGDFAHEVYLRDDTPAHQPQKMGVLQNAAIATSANYFVSNESTNVTGHLIDPSTHSVVTTKRSFTVIAPECAVADALTKIYAVTKNAQHPAIEAMGGIGLECVG